MDLEARKYPIGKMKIPTEYSDEIIRVMINDMQRLPQDVSSVALKLTKKQLHTSYRDGGWSAIQIIHHLADSQIHGYIRLKLALTENNPIIKTFDEDLWAVNNEAMTENIKPSLMMLEATHDRMCNTFSSMTIEEFNRTYFHPDSQRNVDLLEHLSKFHWHGRHHLGHLRIISTL